MKRTRFFCLLLALAVVFALLPTVPQTASAAGPNPTLTPGDECRITSMADANAASLGYYTTLAEALAVIALEPEYNYNIEILKNISITGDLTIPGGQEVYFWLNGYDVTVSGDLISHAQRILQINGDDPGGSLSVDGVILHGFSYETGLYVCWGAVVTIANDLTANTCRDWQIAVSVDGFWNQDSKLIVGGDINSNGTGIKAFFGTTATVGGSIYANGYFGIHAYFNADVTVGGDVIVPYGGGVEAWEGSTVTIIGTINAVPRVSKDSMSTVTYTYTPTGKDVCEIVGGARYEFLEDALYAVADGQTIRLLSNITYNSRMWIANGVAFTIDLNGNSVTFDKEGIIIIINESDVTFAATGGGILQCTSFEVFGDSKLYLPFSPKG